MRWFDSAAQFEQLVGDNFGGFRYQLIIKDRKIAIGNGKSQQDAKRDACSKGLKIVEEMIREDDRKFKVELKVRPHDLTI